MFTTHTPDRGSGPGRATKSTNKARTELVTESRKGTSTTAELRRAAKPVLMGAGVAMTSSQIARLARSWNAARNYQGTAACFGTYLAAVIATAENPSPLSYSDLTGDEATLLALLGGVSA